MIVTKVLFLLAYSVYYCVWQLRELMLEDHLGLEGKAGIFGAIVSIGTFCGALFWGKVADATRAYKKLLVLNAFLGCGCFLGLWKAADLVESWKLPVSLGLFFGFSFFVGAFQPLVDVLVLQLLSHPSKYGREKLWGSVAQGGIAFVVTLLVEKWTWTIIFPLMIALNLAFVAVLLIWVPACKSSEDSEEKVSKNSKSLRELFAIESFRYLLSVALMLGIVRGIFSVFISGFQKNVLEMSRRMLIVGVQSGIALEIGCFFFGKQISSLVQRDASFLISCLCYALRIGCYLGFCALLNAKHASIVFLIGVPIIELLKGASYALMHIPAMTIIKGEVGEETQATAQALYTGTFNNLSALIASCAGEGLNWWQVKRYSDLGKRDKQLNVGVSLFVIAFGFTLLASARIMWKMRTKVKKQPEEMEYLDHDRKEKGQETMK